MPLIHKCSLSNSRAVSVPPRHATLLYVVSQVTVRLWILGTKLLVVAHLDNGLIMYRITAALGVQNK